MLITPWVTSGAKCRISTAYECGTAMSPRCCLGHSHHLCMPPAEPQLSWGTAAIPEPQGWQDTESNNWFCYPSLILLWRWESSASWRHPHLKHRWFSCNGLGHMLIKKGDRLELSNTPRGSTWVNHWADEQPPQTTPTPKSSCKKRMESLKSNFIYCSHGLQLFINTTLSSDVSRVSNRSTIIGML